MRLPMARINSAIYDQPFRNEPPLRKILVLSPPRTGSSTLCRLMFASGMGVPNEYFNELFFLKLAKRFQVPVVETPRNLPADFWQNYLQSLLTRRTRGGIFSAKIQYKQYHLFLKKSVGDALLEDAVIVYLTRKDLLAQAVSWHFAEITGKWDFDETVLTKPKPNKEFFDLAAINLYIREIMAEQKLWERLFEQKNIDPLRITSTDLQQSPAKILQAIADRCGIAHDRLRLPATDERPYPADPSLPSKRAVMEFWLRERQATKNQANLVTPAPRAQINAAPRATS